MTETVRRRVRVCPGFDHTLDRIPGLGLLGVSPSAVGTPECPVPENHGRFPVGSVRNFGMTGAPVRAGAAEYACVARTPSRNANGWSACSKRRARLAARITARPTKTRRRARDPARRPPRLPIFDREP